MSSPAITPATAHRKAATTASIVAAFACVYFFWGSTYTAIRVGAANIPPFLMAGTRFLISGFLMLAWCRWRGLRLFWPIRTMLTVFLVGFLLLGLGNVPLIYAEKTVPSGLASLIWAVTPLFMALFEMALPGGEPLPRRGWLGLLIGFGGLAVLLSPSLHAGIHGDAALLLAIGALIGGSLSWTAGSILSRRSRLQVNILVAASWQMLTAGVFGMVTGTALGQWPGFHLNAASIGALAWLVTGGSLIGYTAYIYLIEHVPIGKVASYAYVNPVVAVLLGIAVLHERPDPAEFAGMALIVAAVFLLSTSRITVKPNRTAQQR